MSPEREAEARLNHTPTPWDVFVGDARGRGLIRIETSIDADPAGVHVASFPRGPQGEANAAFIVRACNSHEALGTKLRNCIAALTFVIDGWDESDPYITKLRATRDGAQAALNAASEPSVTTEAAE